MKMNPQVAVEVTPRRALSDVSNGVSQRKKAKKKRKKPAKTLGIFVDTNTAGSHSQPTQLELDEKSQRETFFKYKDAFERQPTLLSDVARLQKEADNLRDSMLLVSLSVPTEYTLKLKDLEAKLQREKRLSKTVISNTKAVMQAARVREQEAENRLEVAEHKIEQAEHIIQVAKMKVRGATEEGTVRIETALAEVNQRASQHRATKENCHFPLSESEETAKHTAEMAAALKSKQEEHAMELQEKQAKHTAEMAAALEAKQEAAHKAGLADALNEDLATPVGRQDQASSAEVSTECNDALEAMLVQNLTEALMNEDSEGEQQLRTHWKLRLLLQLFYRHMILLFQVGASKLADSSK
jgi:hypothetical protein